MLEVISNSLNSIEKFEPDYVLAVLFSLLIIALFSARSVQKLLDSPEYGDYKLLNHLSAATVSGKKSFRRAYIFYFLVLSAILIVLCISQPVFQKVVGITVPEKYKFTEPIWPVSCALAIVGLLPSTPIFEKIELEVRRLAHRVADIPDRFLNAISRIEQSDLQKIFLEHESTADLANQFRTIANLLELSGYSEDEANRLAKNVLISNVFFEWTASSQASEIWSAKTRNQFGEIVKSISDDFESFEPEIQRLIALSTQSKLAANALTNLGYQSWQEAIESGKIKELEGVFDQNLDERKMLFEQWKSQEKRISKFARQISALFVVFITNDSSPKIAPGQTVLERAAHLATSNVRPSTLNAAIIGVFFAFVATFVLSLCAYLISDAPENIDSFLNSLTKAVEESVVRALNLIFLFGAVAVMTVGFRYSNLQSRIYIKYDGNEPFPVIQTLRIFIYGLLISVFMFFVSYVIYHLVKNNLGDALESDNIYDPLLFSILFGVCYAIYALAVAFLADHRSLELQKKFGYALIFSVVVGFVSLCVSLYYPGFDQGSFQFWLNTACYSVFTLVGLLIFQISLTYQRKERKPGNW